MPPPERLPDDIKELVYRNGFELGHSTWESDVSEMIKRLGLDKDSATSTHGPAVDSNSAVSAVYGPFKASWVLVTLVVIVIAAAVPFYQKARDQGSASEIVASFPQSSGSPPQQPAGPSSQQLAGSPPQQPAGSQPQQPAGPSSQQPAASPPQQPAGFGAIKIANLKTRTVEVYEQKSSGDGAYAAGYAGTISLTTPTLQVPAGTYKLKFANLFVEHVAVTSARSLELSLGTIGLPNLTRSVEVYEQKSSGDGAYAAGYAGTISPTTPTLQVPAGTYKLKFANLFVQPVRVESGKTVIAQ